MSYGNYFSRRRFLKGAAAVSAAAPYLLSSSTLPAKAASSANNRITIGVIGVGKRGRTLLHRFLNDDQTRVLAVSEVSTVRREDAVERVNNAYSGKKKSGNYQGCQGYNDFRDLLARDDIDAVVIGTPDHWHAIPAIRAAKAGKDVYCEKPLSHTVHEGRGMAAAARQNRTVFQTGSQQRTGYNGRFRRAVECVRSGRLGRIKTVHVGVGSPPILYDLKRQAMPEGLDWDMWIGPAPTVVYNEVLCPKGVHNNFPDWRNYQEFGGGGLADWGAHHFDIAQWALGMQHSGPVKVIPPEDGSNKGLKFIYANGIEMIHGGQGGVTFEGTDGTLHVDRGSLSAEPKSIIKEPLGANEFHLEDPEGDHQQNWIDCIQSRKRPVADVEIGHRSATICHLAQIGYRYGRPLQWDPHVEQFEADPWANDDLGRPKRDPWEL